MKFVKTFLFISFFIFLTGCGTSDQFKSVVKSDKCITNYAVLANPITANGSVDDSVASYGCNDSLAASEADTLRSCETSYGKKCLITMIYSRHDDRFESTVQRNISAARQGQAQQYYENLKDRCVLIGYAKGTAQNSDCVMRLVQNAEQLQQQQNVINQQQQDNRYWQMLQGLQILNQPVVVPSQTTCNQVGQYINCTTR